MFGLFNKKKIEVFSPIKGKVIDITEVEDEVFSAKMMGDGFAVEPDENFISAPCDGEIAILAKTKHAVAIRAEGVEILIHIGLDTVELEGKGFTAYVKEAELVKRGDKLISFDAEYIKKEGKRITTVLAITNMDEKVKRLAKNLQTQEAVLKIEVK